MSSKSNLLGEQYVIGENKNVAEQLLPPPLPDHGIVNTSIKRVWFERRLRRSRNLCPNSPFFETARKQVSLTHTISFLSEIQWIRFSFGYPLPS